MDFLELSNLEIIVSRRIHIFTFFLLLKAIFLVQGFLAWSSTIVGQGRWCEYNVVNFKEMDLVDLTTSRIFYVFSDPARPYL